MRPYYFISIPRTGTNSVRKSLGIPRSGKTNHKPAKVIKSKCGDAQWDTAFKFTFVRNPYDRLVSYFRYCKTIGRRLSKAHRANYQGNFKQWVARGCPHHFRNGIGDPIHMWGYLLDDQGNNMVDFVGRVEHFDADFKKLCTKLGVANRCLRHDNTSKRLRNYRLYYDDETRELADRICARDVKLFGYTF